MGNNPSRAPEPSSDQRYREGCKLAGSAISNGIVGLFVSASALFHLVATERPTKWYCGFVQTDMALLLALLFLVGLPAVAFAILRFADTLLMKRIPQFDPATTKTRTDIYSMRAAYASFIVGLAILAFWALAIVVLGFLGTLKVLWP
jgi:hypothetical protein